MSSGELQHREIGIFVAGVVVWLCAITLESIGMNKLRDNTYDSKIAQSMSISSAIVNLILTIIVLIVGIRYDTNLLDYGFIILVLFLFNMIYLVFWGTSNTWLEDDATFKGQSDTLQSYDVFIKFRTSIAILCGVFALWYLYRLYVAYQNTYGTVGYEQPTSSRV